MPNSCDTVMHAALSLCKNKDDSKCMREQGVVTRREDAACANPTTCVVAGNSSKHFVCLHDDEHGSTTQHEPQIVYGRPHFGGPSKVIRGTK